MKLTKKETDLLKDLKNEEKLCAEKYAKHAENAVDPQLNKLFTQISQTEQHHLDTLQQIESGTVPQPGSGSQKQPTFKETYGTRKSADKENDTYLCADVLTMEKHASHLYDTCIFEFKDENIRNTLNHIQKEEQGHGKMIYDYMATNGMYS